MIGSAAVEDLNLGVRRAEVYGFLGPSGAGRTTTSLVLLGLLKPSSETAKVLGEEPDALVGLMQINALGESAALNPSQERRGNLRVAARYSSCTL